MLFFIVHAVVLLGHKFWRLRQQASVVDSNSRDHVKTEVILLETPQANGAGRPSKRQTLRSSGAEVHVESNKGQRRQGNRSSSCTGSGRGSGSIFQQPPRPLRKSILLLKQRMAHICCVLVFGSFLALSLTVFFAPWFR